MTRSHLRPLLLVLILAPLFLASTARGGPWIDPEIESPFDYTDGIAYDHASNPILRIDRNVNVTQVAFDLLGRPEQVQYFDPNSLGVPTETETFVYDHFGDLVSVTNGELTYSFTYDNQHRVLTQTDQRLGRSLAFSYDAAGRLITVAGAPSPASSELAEPVFSGVDTRLQGIAGLLPDAERPGIAERLARIADLATGARQRLGAASPRAAVEPLVEIVRTLREVAREIAAFEGTPAENAAYAVAGELIAEKQALANEALAGAAQVLADAATDLETAVPGESFEARSLFWNAGGLAVADLTVTVHSPAGWVTVGSRPAEPTRARFATELTDERLIDIEVPAGSRPPAPYFLRQPRRGDLYDWSETAPAVRGEPFEPPPLFLRFAFTVAGEPIVLEREVVYRARDQAVGEVRRPLRAVPELEVAARPELVVWPAGAERTEALEITVVSNVDRPVAARLEVAVPAPWRPVAPIDLDLEPARPRVVEVELAAASGAAASGRSSVGVAVVYEGRRFDRAVHLIDYPHIRPVAMLEPARVEISAGDIRWPRLGRIGYLRGASDRMPEALIRIGLPLEVLTADELATRDLSSFDAIVVGSRAYEVDPALLRTSPLLLDYARAGGLVIVQYQQYQFTRGGYAPFPLEIHRPHGRVTDEAAPVTMLEPEHPAFTAPNRIGDADWQGWVQERGLYMAGTWDDAYRPLLAMADPGGEEQRGALLVARLGEGHYVYTGLAFFRQLPAGVAGAYRLFANLLALGTGDGDGSGDST